MWVKIAQVTTSNLADSGACLNAEAVQQRIGCTAASEAAAVVLTSWQSAVHIKAPSIMSGSTVWTLCE